MKIETFLMDVEGTNDKVIVAKLSPKDVKNFEKKFGYSPIPVFAETPEALEEINEKFDKKSKKSNKSKKKFRKKFENKFSKKSSGEFQEVEDVDDDVFNEDFD